MSNEPAVPLSRDAGHSRPAAPVRMMHLGMGNFFRAHQAWYTDRSPDAADWGIVAFAGRARGIADDLAEQGGLYTLITRGAEGDDFTVVGSLSAAHAGSDHQAWLDHWRLPDLALVTLTVTEAGYRRRADGGLDLEDPEVAADLAAIVADHQAQVQTAPARLLTGLLARAAAGGGPVAIVSCDNLPDNGAAVSRVVGDLAAALGGPAPETVARMASFVTTMVDRITPRTTDDDRATVRASTGRDDRAPVVTEPFSEWVIAGDFPAGRPRWDVAGARIVDDLAPFEQRKLWLLNGGHSLLAYAAAALGHRTVAEAVADERCQGWLQQWWDEAAPYLTLPAADVAEYRQALVTRFANPRIRHLLAQIAADGSSKLPVRILPVLRQERAAGRLPAGAVRVLGAWVNHLRGNGIPVTDTQADAVLPLAEGPLEQAVPAVLGHLDLGLAADTELVSAVAASATELAALTAPTGSAVP